jgi:hypothetical protein
LRKKYVVLQCQSVNVITRCIRYFFHATEFRKETVDYGLSSDEDIVDDDALDVAGTERSPIAMSAAQEPLPEWLQPERNATPPEISSGWDKVDPDSSDTESEPELVEPEHNQEKESDNDEDGDESYHFVEEDKAIDFEPTQASGRGCLTPLTGLTT